MIDVHFDKDCDKLIARISGELDLVIADKFRTAVDQALDRGNCSKLILDLSRVTFIDSSGLGVILGRYKRLTPQGGVMAIVAPQPQVEKILEFSGIKRIIKLYASEKEALDEI